MMMSPVPVQEEILNPSAARWTPEAQAFLETAKGMIPNLPFFAKQDIRYPIGESFNESAYRTLGFTCGVLFRALHAQVHITEALPMWLNTLQAGQPLEALETLSVVVGRDVRLTSEAMFSTLCQGLRLAGVQPIDLGIIPTPAMYFAENWLNEHPEMRQTLQEQTGTPVMTLPIGGLMVTASHNPSEYNGLKVTFGCKPLGENHLNTLKVLYAHCHQVMSQIADSHDLAIEALLVPSTKAVPFKTLEYACEWLLNALKPRFGLPEDSTACPKLKIVVDAGNATGGLLAPQLLRAMGHEVIELFCEPDGRFPNHHPDPCAQVNLLDLQAKVLETQADFGVAYDGDSDRLGVVDNRGRVIPGDQVTLFFAEDILQGWHHCLTYDPQRAMLTGEAPRVVFEVKSTQLLTEHLAALGGTPIMSPTGHAVMKANIYRHNAVFGGEMSGHIFFRDPFQWEVQHWGYDDPFYASGRLALLVQQRKLIDPAFELAEVLVHLPATYLMEEKRLSCPKHLAPQVMQHLQTALPEALATTHQLEVTETITLDGLRLNISGGFVLIRPSGTEPKMTTRIEAPSATLAQALEETLVRLTETLIQQALAQEAVSAVG
ncbi:MAG: phosphomannomutase/phosphoglucomutase [Vampirovibrionales bacterium]